MEKKEECIFCRIARKEIKQEIIEETENFLAFPDANQRTKGHTLIVPKRHFVNLLDMPASLGNELLDVVKKIADKRIREGAEGFNIVVNNFPVAGQVVMHAHVHILPRYKRDDFKVREIV